MNNHNALTSKEFICYHGTTLEAALSIINEGFEFSPSSEDWLGHGAYFFIDGISDPLKNAIEWFENKRRGEEGCVIKTRVKLEESLVLDLRTIEGLKKYNAHRDRIINEFYNDLLVRRDLNIKKRKDVRVDDCIIMEMLHKEKEYKAVIHNIYIKNKLQRNLALESSYPNCTVLCSNELSNIEIVDMINI